MHRVLVLGGEGQLARSLRQVAWPAGFEAVFLGHGQCDVAERPAVDAALDAVSPVALINTSAYTQVDRAEAEEAQASRTNAIGPRVLAQSCEARRIPLIHISTDYVFDGEQESPYTELSVPAPLNAYGRTKLAGDKAIEEHAERYLILRTSWLYSERGGNFVTRILELARSRPELPVVADQTGCPTYAVDLARAICTVLPRCVERDPGGNGLFNFANAGQTNWFDFARAIVAADTGATSRPVIRPVSTASYAAPARRPRYSVLDCRKAESVLGIASRDWREGLAECLAKIK